MNIREPVLLVGLAQTLIALALSFMVKLDAHEIGVIMALVVTMGALALRLQVLPLRRPAEIRDISSARRLHPAGGAYRR